MTVTFEETTASGIGQQFTSATLKTAEAGQIVQNYSFTRWTGKLQIHAAKKRYLLNHSEFYNPQFALVTCQRFVVVFD